jgi:UDP-N-acetylglucosamine 1-carboxyvinyltransferase
MIGNVPHLQDVTTTMELLGRMGVTLTVNERMRIEVDPTTLRQCVAPYELVKTMRASILVLGPMLSHYGQAEVALPGGCAIGSRPVNLHLLGWRRWVRTSMSRRVIFKAHADRLKGCANLFDLVTVTGTENLLMAATLADGETLIENAAREPEVVDLAEFLKRMGAKIQGVKGRDTIRVVNGVKKLMGASTRSCPTVSKPAPYLVAGGGHTRQGTDEEHASRASGCGAGEAGRGRSPDRTGDDWIELDMRGRRPKACQPRTAPFRPFPPTCRRR